MDAGSAHELDLPWLSPTSAGRLIKCKASVTVSANGLNKKSYRAPPPRTVGDIAHLALHNWFSGGRWRQDPDGKELLAVFDATALAAGIDINEIPRGRITRSRTKFRARALWDLLLEAEPDVKVLSELQLEDCERRIRGTLDILVHGPDSLRVIDMKTNAVTTPNGTVSPQVTFQLMIYAALVESNYGHLPDTVEAFSLTDGHHVMRVHETDLAEVRANVRAAQEAWMSGNRLAEPEEATCKFCPRRLECAPHWEVPRVAGMLDSVEGKVMRIVRSADALVSLLLETADGERWLNGLRYGPEEKVAALTGRRIRAIHIFESTQVAPHDRDANTSSLRPTSATEFAVVLPE